MSEWHDVVAVAAGEHYTVGLKADGTVVIAGSKEVSKCGVPEWKLFNSIETLAKEREEGKRQEAERRAEKTRQEAERKAKRKAELDAEAESLRTELSNLKGLFTGKRRKEIETRLTEIDAERKGL